MISNTGLDKRMAPFEPDLFVNREKAKKLFLNKVHNNKVYNRSQQRSYLEFYAVAGQGKTELLKWIYYNGKEEGYFSAYVDFEHEKYDSSKVYPVLKTIADDLSTQISPEPFHSFKELLKSFRDSEDDLIRVFNENLKFVLRTDKIVLCFDSTEKDKAFALQIFEDRVLKDHAKDRNLMLVTAGQKEVVWKNTSIKEMVKRYELTRFDLEAVRKQVKNLARTKGLEFEDSDPIFDKILDLTEGHPLSNYTLIDFWTDGFRMPLKSTVVEKRFKQGIKELIEKVIKVKILEDFQPNEKFPPPEQALWYLAPLRYLNLEIFCKVLSESLEARFREKSFDFFQQLMGEFLAIYIIVEESWGNKLEPVVRSILVWNMRENHAEEFIELHSKCEKLYDSYAKDTKAIDQIMNITESLFHCATRVAEADPQRVSPKVKEKLQRYLDSYFPIDHGGEKMPSLYGQLESLCNTLKKDEDLEKLVEIEELVEIIENHKETLKRKPLKGKSGCQN